MQRTYHFWEIRDSPNIVDESSVIVECEAMSTDVQLPTFRKIVFTSFSVQAVPGEDVEFLTQQNVVCSFETPVIVQKLSRRSVAENLNLKYDFYYRLDTDEKLKGIDEKRTIHMKECNVIISRRGMIRASAR